MFTFFDKNRDFEDSGIFEGRFLGFALEKIANETISDDLNAIESQKTDIANELGLPSLNNDVDWLTINKDGPIYEMILIAKSLDDTEKAKSITEGIKELKAALLTLFETPGAALKEFVDGFNSLILDAKQKQISDHLNLVTKDFGEKIERLKNCDQNLYESLYEYYTNSFTDDFSHLNQKLKLSFDAANNITEKEKILAEYKSFSFKEILPKLKALSDNTDSLIVFAKQRNNIMIPPSKELKNYPQASELKHVFDSKVLDSYTEATIGDLMNDWEFFQNDVVIAALSDKTKLPISDIQVLFNLTFAPGESVNLTEDEKNQIQVLYKALGENPFKDNVNLEFAGFADSILFTKTKPSQEMSTLATSFLTDYNNNLGKGFELVADYIPYVEDLAKGVDSFWQSQDNQNIWPEFGNVMLAYKRAKEFANFSGIKTPSLHVEVFADENQMHRGSALKLTFTNHEEVDGTDSDLAASDSETLEFSDVEIFRDAISELKKDPNNPAALNGFITRFDDETMDDAKKFAKTLLDNDETLDITKMILIKSFDLEEPKVNIRNSGFFPLSLPLGLKVWEKDLPDVLSSSEIKDKMDVGMMNLQDNRDSNNGIIDENAELKLLYLQTVRSDHPEDTIRFMDRNLNDDFDDLSSYAFSIINKAGTSRDVKVRILAELVNCHSFPGHSGTDNTLFGLDELEDKLGNPQLLIDALEYAEHISSDKRFLLKAFGLFEKHEASRISLKVLKYLFNSGLSNNIFEVLDGRSDCVSGSDSEKLKFFIDVLNPKLSMFDFGKRLSIIESLNLNYERVFQSLNSNDDLYTYLKNNMFPNNYS